MKLGLKHLAGHLPYGLETMYNLSDVVNCKKDDTRSKFLTAENCDFVLKYCKPILRPLSDYSKFNEIALEMTNYETEMIDENPDLVGRLSYDVIELMFKNHIDIHGLIPAGLAIDINTLNK